MTSKLQRECKLSFSAMPRGCSSSPKRLMISSCVTDDCRFATTILAALAPCSRLTCEALQSGSPLFARAHSPLRPRSHSHSLMFLRIWHTYTKSSRDRCCRPRPLRRALTGLSLGKPSTPKMFVTSLRTLSFDFTFLLKLCYCFSAFGRTRETGETQIPLFK